jgi:hypothetical protein
MYLFLLKKALPFTLTFIFGAVLSGLTGLCGASEKKSVSVFGTRTYEFGIRSRMRPRNLVAETKPLVILFKPDARRPREFANKNKYEGRGFWPTSALVRVTFGADGKVQEVEPFYEDADGYTPGRLRLTLRDASYVEAWENVKRAARLIQFTPEMRDGVPVTVTKELEIFFFKD